MKLWQLKYYLKNPYTKEQKKVFAGELEMTEDLFWSCVTTVWNRRDHKRFKWLLDTYPQHIQKYQGEYEKRLQDDAAFRAAQEERAAQIKAVLLSELGEEWVAKNWKD